MVGHIYFFLDQVYPKVANIRGWYLKKIIVTPFLLNYIVMGGTRGGGGGGGGGGADGMIRVAEFDPENDDNDNSAAALDTDTNDPDINADDGNHLHQD